MLQSFVPFLDKEKYLVVCFFEFFLNKNPENATTSLAEIQKELAVSAYRLQEIITAAQTICAKNPELYLSQTKEKHLTLTGLDTLQFKKIILFEAQNSLRFRIFIHISLNSHGYSDFEFQKSHNISRSTYFRFKGNLLNDIGDKKIRLLNSSEAYSRYYIYSVIHYFSYLDFLDNNSGKEKLVQSINYVTLLLKLSPTNVQRKQHLYFAAVCYWRSQTGHRLSSTDSAYFVNIKSTPDIVNFTHYLEKSWAITKERAERCVSFFMTFLLALEEVEVKKLPFLHEYSIIEELVQRQLTVVHEALGENFSLLDTASLTNKLLKINAKILIPVFINTSQSNAEEWSFYENSYLTVDKLAKKLLQVSRDYNKVRSVSQEEYSELYYSYLFTLIVEIPTSAFSDQVHIAVDFSQGPEYTDYIKEKLNELLFLNIQIDKFVNSQTDIYLSNHFDPTFKNKQIIWEHPPLTEDFIHLRSLIVRVKNDKH